MGGAGDPERRGQEPPRAGRRSRSAGAFQGRTPQEAYLVKCDKDTNPQNDIDRGVVNIHVGFAPLKPAEFVIVHIQQLAGQIQV